MSDKRVLFFIFTSLTSLYAGGTQQVSSELLPILHVSDESSTLEDTDAASEGTVTAKQIQDRPLLRPAEVLETVPGLIVTQHSGDGKANQYFLRGFSLDHGTDFYTTLDDMPINLPTHAHGQGYSDLNFLIPELINTIEYKKGPYYADEGDFASTGAAHIKYLDSLESGIASVTVGSYNSTRVFNANSFDVGGGKLLYAFEYYHYDGPWKVPEGYQRLNGVMSYTKHDAHTTYKLTAMAYNGDWDATNQVPLRAIEDGTIDRYGSLDPSDGGSSHRYSLSANIIHYEDDATTKLNAYVIDYGLDLFSDFTFYLDNPVQGDQMEQKDSRTITGVDISRISMGSLFGLPSVQTYGFGVRNDAIDVGLYNTQNRQRFNTISSDWVDETDGSLFYQNELTLNDKTRMIAGLRGDLYRFDLKSYAGGAQSGVKTAAIASPKLSFIFGPWSQTEIFLDGGYGYHSNDARGIMNATAPATPLVRTKGAEISVRTQAVPHLQTSLSFWMMDSDSELVFSGDSGGTEATGAARRMGVEWANYWTPFPWVIIDADATFSQARYRDPAQEGGAYVPEAMEQTFSMGIAVKDYKNYFGGLRVRYFGSRALMPDDSVRSDPSTLVNLKAGRHLSKNLDLSLDVLNLFNAQTYDIQYYYESQMKNEASSANDSMVHPGEPRSLRVTLTYKY